MSARTSFCALAIALAVTWLLLPPRHTPAQAPPGESTDQRLRRLEEKMDKLLGGGTSQADDSAALVTLISARDQFQKAVETARQEYHAVCLRQPTLSGPARAEMYMERFAKIEKRRSELQIQLAELQQNRALAEQTYKKDGEAAALALIAGMGVKVALTDATVLDKKLVELTVKRRKMAVEHAENHPHLKELDQQIEWVSKMYSRENSIGPVDVKPAETDLAQAILTAMASEIEGRKNQLHALAAQFEKELKDALGATEMEPNMRRAKAKYEDAQKKLDAVNRALAEIQSSRPSN